MDDKKTDKQSSSYEKISKKFNLFLSNLFGKLKFKKGEHWIFKVIKVLIRISTILFLIAISPLVIFTILLMMVFAG